MVLTQHWLFQKILFPNFNQIIFKMKYYGTLNTSLNAHALILFYEMTSYYRKMTFYANNGPVYLSCKVCFLFGNQNCKL